MRLILINKIQVVYLFFKIKPKWFIFVLLFKSPPSPTQVIKKNNEIIFNK